MPVKQANTAAATATTATKPLRAPPESLPASARITYTRASTTNSEPTRISFDSGEEPMPANTPAACSGEARWKNEAAKPTSTTTSGMSVMRSIFFT